MVSASSTLRGGVENTLCTSETMCMTNASYEGRNAYNDIASALTCVVVLPLVLFPWTQASQVYMIECWRMGGSGMYSFYGICIPVHYSILRTSDLQCLCISTAFSVFGYRKISNNSYTN